MRGTLQINILSHCQLRRPTTRIQAIPACVLCLHMFHMMCYLEYHNLTWPAVPSPGERPERRPRASGRAPAGPPRGRTTPPTCTPSCWVLHPRMGQPHLCLGPAKQNRYKPIYLCKKKTCIRRYHSIRFETSSKDDDLQSGVKLSSS